MNTRNFILFLFSIFLMPACTQASAVEGQILENHSFAWSDQGGWINFRASSGGVKITDSALTGYAWATNHGWIKLDPIAGGVKNNGAGDLSGSAWGEQLGWISFENVSIDSNGKFHGTASGTLIGTLTFDCEYCDVETDWRYASSRVSSEQPVTALGAPVVPALFEQLQNKEEEIKKESEGEKKFQGGGLREIIEKNTKEKKICLPYITDVILKNKKNNTENVKRLQSFFKNQEGFMDILENGFFDEATQRAVSLFQERYRNEILVPAGLSQPTGDVGIATKNLINKRVCEGTQFKMESKQEEKKQQIEKEEKELKEDKKINIFSKITSVIQKVFSFVKTFITKIFIFLKFW